MDGLSKQYRAMHYCVKLTHENDCVHVYRLQKMMRIMEQSDDNGLKTNKKFSYRRGTARCVVSVKILPIATQQCSTTIPEQIEVMKLKG